MALSYLTTSILVMFLTRIPAATIKASESKDFPLCFDELDCEEGYCCISDISGAEGRCLPCDWNITMSNWDEPSNPSKPASLECKNSCPNGLCCIEGKCERCLQLEKSDDGLRDDPCGKKNPCPPGECCFFPGDCFPCLDLINFYC